MPSIAEMFQYYGDLQDMKAPELIDISFTSFSEFNDWNSENIHVSDVNNIFKYVEYGLSNGINNSLLGNIDGSLLSYKGTNHRERYRGSGFNARQRYLLDRISREVLEMGGKNTKIYAPEAITDLALIIRGNFPYFMGSEYVETEEEIRNLFPVRFEDLSNLSFGNSSFDLVFSADVFEHLPFLDKCLRELRRITKDGGVMLATFPFSNTANGLVMAEFIDGDIVYKRKPIYHGNPVDKRGSLVFSFPGWDIIQRCKNAGWASAEMLFTACPTRGIVGNEFAGDFMLRASA